MPETHILIFLMDATGFRVQNYRY